MTRGYSQLYVHLSGDWRDLMMVFLEDWVCRAVWNISHCQAFWEGMVKLVLGLVFLIYRSIMRLEGESAGTALYISNRNFIHTPRVLYPFPDWLWGTNAGRSSTESVFSYSKDREVSKVLSSMCSD